MYNILIMLRFSDNFHNLSPKILKKIIFAVAGTAR